MIRMLTLLLVSGAVALAESSSVGDDLLLPFSAALQGKPLRAVAVGTSFTQAGEGWIGDWLKQRFPDNPLVSLRNSGMSSMGLLFHNFRLDRDVVAFQPDLVLLESGPNDGDLSEEQKLRALESIVVRLKSLPHSPAIIIIDSASANQEINRRMAEHYGLLRVNVYEAMQQAYARDPSLRGKLTIPDGHPSSEGHAFFAKTIREALEPHLQRARDKIHAVRSQLPQPLSSLPLYQDARLVQLTPQMGTGWTMTVDADEALRRQYLGTLSSSQKGASLEIPVRGTTVGIFYSMKPGAYGRFYANVDGGPISEINTDTRGGYSYVILGDDLSPQEHIVRIVYPSDGTEKPVHLAYLMVAGEAGSTHDLAKQGSNDIDALKSLSFRAIPASVWLWAGPYGEKTEDNDAREIFQKSYLPESDEFSHWQKISESSEAIDFSKLPSLSTPSVNYALLRLHSPTERTVWVRFTVNYFGRILVNGRPVFTIDSGHGSPADPLPFFPILLRQGENEILVKVGSGSRGNDFSLSLSHAHDIEILSPHR